MAASAQLADRLRDLKMILKDLEDSKKSIAMAVAQLDGPDKSRAIRDLRSVRDEIAKTHAQIKEVDYKWWKKTFGRGVKA